MKILYLTAFLAIFSTAKAQQPGPELPNYDFESFSMQACPSDSTISYLEKDSWQAYQTTNDLWDGPRISNCASIHNNNNCQTSAKIDLYDFDTTKVIFIRAELNDQNKLPFVYNSLYSLNLWHATTSGLQLDLSNNCANEACTGILLGFQIPDSTGTGTTMSWTTRSGLGTQHIESQTLCFATENFPDQIFLREFIIKVKASNINSVNRWIAFHQARFISFGRAGSQDFSAVAELNDSLLATTRVNDTTYLIDSYDLELTNSLVVRQDNNYPSPNAISFLTLKPQIPSATAKILTLEIDDNHGLHFQAYMRLRGDTLLGDTLRHPISLVNNGGSICMDALQEVVFQDEGGGYVHRAGSVQFNGPTSCMLFGKGSSLRVAPGSTFNYGENNKGILALKPGGTLKIDPGAELIIHNKLYLDAYKGEQPEHIWMQLDKGSKLTFAEGSRLQTGDDMKLYIRMQGGLVDLSGLPEQDVKNVVLVYPSNSTKPTSDLIVVGNPVQDQLKVSFNAASDQNSLLTVNDINGRVVHQESITIQNGSNQHKVDLQALKAGVYLVEVVRDGEVLNQKFVKR